MRSTLSITFSVWQAIFLREALDRLFGMRAAWFWLLAEPSLHIGFIAVVWGAIRVHTIGGVDTSLWIIVGMLAFFLYRRTAIQAMYAVDCNKPFFAYRQVKPFDTALVRAALEGFLMLLVSVVILSIAGLLGLQVLPNDPLLVILSASGLWLFGLGYGLISSVLMELARELEHLLKIAMMPLYLISGVIWPISSIPPQYRHLLLTNPILHGLESVRLGYFASYRSVNGISLGYLYFSALVTIFIGLALYRRYAYKLVMQ